MKKLILIVVCACFIVLPRLSFAQWTQVDVTNFPKIIGNNLLTGTSYCEKVTCMAIDGNGIVYAGTNEQGVWKFNGTIWSATATQNTNLPTILAIDQQPTALTTCGPRFPPVQAMAIDVNNNVYITFNGVTYTGTKQTILGNNLATGVYRYSAGSWSAFNTNLPISIDVKTPILYNSLLTSVDFIFVSRYDKVYFRYIGTGGASPCSCASGNWCELALTGLPVYDPVNDLYDVINNLHVHKRGTFPDTYDLIIGTTSGIYTYNLGGCISTNFNCGGAVTDLKFRIGGSATNMNALDVTFKPPATTVYINALFAIGGTNSINPPTKGDIQLGSVYRYVTTAGNETDGDWEKLDTKLAASTYTSNYNINAKLHCWKDNSGMSGVYKTIISYKKPGLNGLVMARTSDNGNTWSTTPYAAIPTSDITCFEHQKVTGTYVYAGTINQGVWRIPVSSFKMDDTDLPEESKVQVSVSPNPFDQSTSFELTIPFDEKISVFLYNVNGQLVSKIVDGEAYNAGVYNIVYNSSSLINGVYYYQVIGDKTSITGKIVKN